MRKRGYFFTLDAFIALGVIVAGTILVLSSYNYQPYQTQTIFLAQDLLNSLEDATVKETNNPYLQELRTNGNITNLDKTLLEQMGEFYIRGDYLIANKLAYNLTKGRIPPQYGYSILIDESTIYATGPQPEKPRFLVASKTIISGMTNTTFWWGPLEAEVDVWQR